MCTIVFLNNFVATVVCISETLVISKIPFPKTGCTEKEMQKWLRYVGHQLNKLLLVQQSLHLTK